jgi:hypothetical protein
MTTAYTGSYSPEMYNEDKRYYLLQAQQLSGLTDAELRDMHKMSNTYIRRFIQEQVGDGAIDTGFKIVQHPTDNTNNFLITGGDGTNPGVLFLNGYRLFLNNSIGYKDQTNSGSLTDAAFTETTLPALTVPYPSDRTDYVYIDFHLGEVSADGSSEYYDISLKDSTVGLPSQNRLRIVQDVKVSEGSLYPSNYSDGSVQHYTYPLAKICRPFSQSTILNSYITDLRTVTKTVSELNQILFSGDSTNIVLPANSVTPDKLNIGSDYTFSSIQVLSDSTFVGNLVIGGTVPALGVDNFTANISSVLSGVTHVNGQIRQENDSSVTAYNIVSNFPTENAPIFNITQYGIGDIFNVSNQSDSTNSIFNVASNGTAYDFNISHISGGGGILNSTDDSTNPSFNIVKSSSFGNVFNISSQSSDSIFDIAGQGNSISINQTGGTALE